MGTSQFRRKDQKKGLVKYVRGLLTKFMRAWNEKILALMQKKKKFMRKRERAP